ncbi:hypothetical protein LZ31DRAFT_322504 [Colletotrichum somersetense]|nr:hypothetical protein LZ31DRAFT_322504 [Colletotrichum somersetense]
MEFSVTNDAAVFGLNDSLHEHQEKLQAAGAFSQIRKELERNQTTLRTLTDRNFKRRPILFEKNAEQLVREDEVSLILLPLVKICSSQIDKPINWLLLALFSLTETAVASITKHGLSEVYAALFPRALKDCIIFEETRQTLIATLRRMCHKYDTATSQKNYYRRSLVARSDAYRK